MASPIQNPLKLIKRRSRIKPEESSESKRSRKNNSGAVLVFDEAKFREHLTGFRKRKLQRQREGADLQHERKRQERLAKRKEVCFFFSSFKNLQISF